MAEGLAVGVERFDAQPGEPQIGEQVFALNVHRHEVGLRLLHPPSPPLAWLHAIFELLDRPTVETANGPHRIEGHRDLPRLRAFALLQHDRELDQVARRRIGVDRQRRPRLGITAHRLAPPSARRISSR